MQFIHSAIKLVSLLAILGSINAFAGDIPIDNHTKLDRNDTAYGGKNYEIDKMLVNWDSKDQITVDIYTNFGSNNNKHRASNPGRNIIYGDLLISTGGTESDFNYAFSLGRIFSSEHSNWTNNSAANYKYSGHERYYTHNNKANKTYTSGGLYEISDTVGSTDYHTNGGVRDGEVFADLSAGSSKANASNESWGVNNSRHDFDIFSFSFNVANIDAFQNASQLSLSWAMSCYNDVVTATIDKSSIAVPLPTTSILLILALVILLLGQNKQAQRFDA